MAARPHLEQVANALLHLRKTECDGCNGAADVIVSLEEQLEAANKLLIDLVNWSPQTQAGREALHPQHRAIVEAAEVFVSNPASQPWKYGDPIKATMTVSSPTSEPKP